MVEESRLAAERGNYLHCPLVVLSTPEERLQTKALKKKFKLKTQGNLFLLAAVAVLQLHSFFI